MKKEVFFTNIKQKYSMNLIKKLELLANAAGFKKLDMDSRTAAIKLHFGEEGNLAYIRPPLVQKIVEMVRDSGGRPFLTDTNTLYAGSRSNGISHIHTAIRHGFAPPVIDAPVIIADGLMGKHETTIPINGKIYDKVFIAGDIVDADFLIVLSHVKGHELAGFGGAIKNLGMGCASRQGKMSQHSDLCPSISKKRCIGCGECVSHCLQQAIQVDVKKKKAIIDKEKCSGCGECIAVCPRQAISVQWNPDTERFQLRMAEYALGAIKNKENRSFFINFVINVSPACDCMPFNNPPIVPDIGILASIDPVAVDKASLDLINKQPSAIDLCPDHGSHENNDKFRQLYTYIDPGLQLRAAEKLGMGSTDYELIEINIIK